jgi:signal peptidase
LTQKRAAQKILAWFMNVIVALAVLLVVLMFLAPRYGISMNPVLSGSMEPALKVGGVVVTRLITLGEVERGDIISYKIGEQRITHRVVEVGQEGGKIHFQTKGDANEEPDPYAVIPKGEQVPKVVFFVPYFGFLADFMKQKANFFLLIGIPAVLLIALYMRDIWREARKACQKPVPDSKARV